MTRSKDYNKNRFAFVIPVYNHAGTVAQVAKDAQKLGYPVVVVDDGSTDDTYNQIKEIMAGKHVPWTSSFGKKFSNFWVRASGGPAISDSQSGFRIYPLPEALNLKTKARRFQFEVEILVHAERNGIPVIEAPIRVRYNPEGGRISHFRPFVDFCRNSSTFTRLIFTRIFPPR